MIETAEQILLIATSCEESRPGDHLGSRTCSRPGRDRCSDGADEDLLMSGIATPDEPDKRLDGDVSRRVSVQLALRTRGCFTPRPAPRHWPAVT